jgi:putative DNA primase/helicase
LNIFEAAKSVSIIQIAQDVHGLQIQKQGTLLVACCPFHDEKDPSCTFYEETNSFTCFGCEATGSSIDYVVKSGLATTPKGAAEYIINRWMPGASIESKTGQKENKKNDVIANDNKPYTLADYSRDKHLPIGFLQGLNITDKQGWIHIPYRLEDGSPGPVRYRQWQQFRWAKGSKLCLYGLDRLNRPGNPEDNNDFIIAVEGESDSQTLWYHKYPALGVPGAKNFKADWVKYLTRFEKVYLHQEPDEAGQYFVRKVATLLKSANYQGQVFIFSIPGYKDPNELHKNTDDFKTALNNVLNKARKPSPEELGEQQKESFSLTDMGNAKRLVARHGENIRYCHAWKSWLIWDETRWKSDENKIIFELAKDTTNHIPDEIKTALDDNEVKAIIGHAKRSESEARLKSMINLAQSEPGIPVASDQLDQDTWLLNCRNGIVDLRSGVLMPHDKGILLTKLALVDYDQGAKCEIFEAFLSKIMAGNTSLTDFLQRAFGYSLTGDISEHKIFFLYGSGANGKSTLLEAVKNVMGDYARQTPITTFTLRNNGNDSSSNDLAGLKGSRMVSATEAEETHRLAESLVKSVTGGDTIACRFLFKEFFEYAPQFKVFISTNRKPYIAGTDLGIWRRVCLVPFDVSITEAEQDRKLAEKLRAEQQGILIWLLTGCLRWQRLGLEIPDEVKVATEEYKTEMDWLAGFLDECCILTAQMSCGSTELYDEYVKWAERNGEKIRSQTKFGVALSEKKLEKGRGGTGRVRWMGIGLKIEEKTEWSGGKVIPMNQQDRWG